MNRTLRFISISSIILLNLALTSCGKKELVADAAGAAVCGSSNRFSAQDPACSCQSPTGHFGQSTDSGAVQISSSATTSFDLVAQPFVNKSATSNTIGQVTLSMSMELSTDSLSSVAVSIRADCAGHPCTTTLSTGSISKTLPIIASVSTATPGTAYTAVLSKVVQLNSGATYWLVAQAIGLNTNGNSGAWQLDGAQGSFPGTTSLAMFSVDTGTTWTAIPNTVLTFSLATCN